MYVVYLDNFRGFEKQFTSLTQVTFLVGENSTGKSSFLAAVELMSSIEFWSEPGFNKYGHNLGSFQDILSLNATRRSYFTMGWVDIVHDSERHPPMFALLTFKERRGKPQLYRYSFLLDDTVVSIQYTQKAVKYRLDVVNGDTSDRKVLIDCFAAVADRHHQPLKSAKLVDDGGSGFPFRSPYFGPPDFVKELSDKFRKQKVRSPVMLNRYDLKSIAPIRTTPQTIYDAVESDEDALGSHTPYVLRRELSKRGGKNLMRKSLRDFGKKSGLYQDVKVHNFGRSDESISGSGAPFEVGVVLESNPINLPYVGYGVSQVLPIIVDMIRGENSQDYVIQQPEVHLHPKAQAALGEFVFEFASLQDKWFFIETHSDYLIDRFRLSMSKASKETTRPVSSVVFFERDKGLNQSAFIPIQPDGKYSEDQPSSFREFFLNESIDLMKI